MPNFENAWVFFVAVSFGSQWCKASFILHVLTDHIPVLLSVLLFTVNAFGTENKSVGLYNISNW